MTNTTPTNYVVVIEFDPSDTYLENQLIVGWDNEYDWYTEVDGSDLLTPTGRLKKREGCCINIDRWIGGYVDPELEWMTKLCESSKKEGYNGTVCRLEKDLNNEWIVVPV